MEAGEVFFCRKEPSHILLLVLVAGREVCFHIFERMGKLEDAPFTHQTSIGTSIYHPGLLSAE